MAKKFWRKNEDGIALRTYLRSLPVCDAPRMARELADVCKVPVHTFNNWRSGLVKIPELAKDKIEEVTGCQIFNREQ